MIYNIYEPAVSGNVRLLILPYVFAHLISTIKCEVFKILSKAIQFNYLKLNCSFLEKMKWQRLFFAAAIYI